MQEEEISNFLNFLIKQKATNNSNSYGLIKSALNQSIIPFPFLPIEAGKSFYRIRPHQKDEVFFQSINDIAHNKCIDKITSFGRANEPHQSIFYCSDYRETAFFETSSTVRGIIKPDIEIYTLGKWTLQKDILVAVLPLSVMNFGKNKTGDTIHSRIEEILQEFAHEFNPQLRRMLDFFSLEFSQECSDHTSNKGYLISCAFANYTYERVGINLKTNSLISIAGIVYPSVQYRKGGMNLALNPKFIENQTLKLDTAARITIEKTDEKRYSETEIIVAENINHLVGNIIW